MCDVTTDDTAQPTDGRGGGAPPRLPRVGHPPCWRTPPFLRGVAASRGFGGWVDAGDGGCTEQDDRRGSRRPTTGRVHGRPSVGHGGHRDPRRTRRTSGGGKQAGDRRGDPPTRGGSLHRPDHRVRGFPCRRAPLALRGRPQPRPRRRRVSHARGRLGPRALAGRPAGRRRGAVPRPARRVPPGPGRAPRPAGRAGALRRVRRALLQPSPPGPRRTRRAAGREPGRQRGHRLAGPRPVGSGRRHVHRHPRRHGGGSQAPRRPRERPLRGRPPGALGARAVPDDRLCAGARVQEDVHGRVDRTARRGPPAGAYAGAGPHGARRPAGRGPRGPMTTTTLSPRDLAIDHELAQVSERYRFLLDITPLDVEVQRFEFLRGAITEPAFSYRPLEDDPDVMDAMLAAVDVGDVEDATLGHLLRAKHRELALQLDMLRARDTADFLPLSIELYGTVSPALLARAEAILDQIEVPARSRDDHVDAARFAELAEVELAHYRAIDADIGVH